MISKLNWCKWKNKVVNVEPEISNAEMNNLKKVKTKSKSLFSLKELIGPIKANQR